MNAIPLVFNAPKANINVNSVSPINGNSIRTNNKLINATQGMNIGGAAGMLGGGGFSNEAQLRQEVNTSIVALKREAFSLENLIAQAAQTLQDINKRLSELEGKQGDYVKKSDVVDSVTSGNMNPVTSNAVANSNAMPVNSVTSGNMHSVTSGAVYSALLNYVTSNGLANALYGYRNNIGTWFTDNPNIKNDIDSNFTNANEYTLFSGQTATGAECGWYGFKHNNTKGGICIIMSYYYGIFLGYGGGKPSTWNYKCILKTIAD